MSNGNNLMTGRTPVGVSGDARPRYGLPFRQLPGTAQERVTPEIKLKQEIRMGQKQIQQQFTLQWDEINRSARFIGAAKTERLLQQLHTKAKQDMLTFNQKAQVQMGQLRGIDRLVGVGSMDEAQAKKIKTRMMYGPQAAEAMYPEPEKVKEQSFEKQLNTLRSHANRIEDRLAQFRIIGEKLPGPTSKWLWAISPPLAAISAYRGISELKRIKEKGRKGDVQIFDLTIPREIPEIINKKKTGRTIIEMGDYRPATEVEIEEEKLLREQTKEIGLRWNELLEQSDVSRRIAPTGVRGGGFDAGVTEAIHGPAARRQPARQLPKSPDPLGLR